MFANTLTITINGVAKTLTRVNQDNYGSEYVLKTSTDKMTLRFRNSVEKGSPSYDRHNMFFEHIVYATTTTIEKVYTVSAVLRQNDGSDPAYLDYVVAGFITLLTAQKTGMIGGES